MWNNYNQYSRMPFNPTPGYNNFNSPQSFQTSGSSISPYQQPSSVQPQNNLSWVTGKENARSMQLQPNSTVLTLDNQANKFYIKTTDDIGLGRLRVFNYTEQADTTQSSSTQQVSPPDLDNYVTKEQLENIISKLKGEIHEQSLSTTQSTTSTKQQPIIIKK